MRRPLILRLLPDRLRTSVWARCYRKKQSSWPGLYDAAELRYAPGIEMELVPGDAISDSIAFTGLYELNTTRRVVELAKRGGTFIDVGANIGYFVLLWVAANPRNTCIAFEASPRNVDLLRRNIRRNNFESRVQVVAKAAGQSAGTLQFDPGPADQTGWGGFASSASKNGFEVDVVRVDEVVAASENVVALLKVDIEGADAWALMGCEGLLRTGRAAEIWFEQNKPRIKALGIAENAAQEYLASLGYMARPRSDPKGNVVEWSATAPK